MSPTVTAPLKASRLLSAGALTLSALLLLPASAVGQDDQGPGPATRHTGPRRATATRGRDSRTRLHRRRRRPRPPRSRGPERGRRARRAAGARRSSPHRGRPRRAGLPQRHAGLSRSLHRGRARGSARPAPRARPPLRARLVDHRRRRARHDRRPWRLDRFPGRRRVPHRRRRHRRRGGRARRPPRSGGAVERGRQRAGAAEPPLGGARRRDAVGAGMDQRRPDHARALGRRPGSDVAERPVRLAEVPAGRARRLRRHLRPARHLAERRDLRRRLVSEQHRRGLAAVLRRPLGLHVELRLDVDRRRRRLGLPHAPLRPLEPGRARLALDPVAALGRGVGVLGGRAGLRRLVPARLERPPGAQRVPLRPQLPVALARSLPRLDGDPAHVVRTRARAGRPRRSRPARSRAAGVRAAASLARLRAAAIAVSVAVQSAPQRRHQRHRSRAGARRRLDDEPAQLRPLRQRPRQPRRPRRPARHHVGGWLDLRVAV